MATCQIAGAPDPPWSPIGGESFTLEVRLTAELDLYFTTREAMKQTYSGAFKYTHTNGEGYSHDWTAQADIPAEVDWLLYSEEPPPQVPVRDRQTDCWAGAFASAELWAGRAAGGVPQDELGTLQSIWDVVPEWKGKAITDPTVFKKVGASVLMNSLGYYDLDDPLKLLRLLEEHGPLVVV
jgi:hypothetical protein